MKMFKTLALAAIASSFALIACGSTDDPGNTEGAQESEQASTASTPGTCWSHQPSFPGETCILKTQCHWITPGDPPQPCSDLKNSECVRHCEKECLYPCTFPTPIVPQPIPN